MLKKIGHIVITNLILVSTIGFTINMHYCHDQLIDLALFSPAHSCCDTGSEGQCHTTDGITNMNHCEDESLQVGSTDDYVVSSFTFENTHNIDLLLTATILNNIQGTYNLVEKEAPWHKKPPPYGEVILSQIQSYLI